MRRPSPSPLDWTILFVTGWSQLPALANAFSGRDFVHLARALGLVDAAAPLATLGDALRWKISVAALGTQAAAHHAAALLALALLAIAAAHVARMGGGGVTGAGLAGLAVALSPAAPLAVAWATASAEVFGWCVATVGMAVWLRSQRSGSPARALLGFVGLALGLLTAISTLGLVAALTAIHLSDGRTAASDAPRRRGERFLLLVLLGIGSAAAIARGGSLTPAAPLRLLGLAAGPLPPLSPSVPDLRVALGGLTLILMGGLALRLRGPQRRLARVAAVTAAVASVAGAWFAPLANAPAVLGLSVALGWSGASLLGPPLDRWLRSSRAPAYRPGLVLALALLLAVPTGWLRTRAFMGARDDHGRLAHPVLRAGAIAADAHRRIAAVLETGAVPPDFVVVLQATRASLPAHFELPENAEILVRSPVFEALAGDTGLDVLVPDPTRARWVTGLEHLPRNTQVLLDAGGDRLSVLGPMDNARIYSALIAVAAGQYPRARADLWAAMHGQGATIRFAFDPDALPISPAELDAEAAGFARFLEDDTSPSGKRLLRLFGQIYASVRGRELLIEGFGPTLRAPRIDSSARGDQDG